MAENFTAKKIREIRHTKTKGNRLSLLERFVIAWILEQALSSFVGGTTYLSI